MYVCVYVYCFLLHLIRYSSHFNSFLRPTYKADKTNDSGSDSQELQQAHKMCVCIKKCLSTSIHMHLESYLTFTESISQQSSRTHIRTSESQMHNKTAPWNKPDVEGIHLIVSTWFCECVYLEHGPYTSYSRHSFYSSTGYQQCK